MRTIPCNRRMCIQVDDLTEEDFAWLVASERYEVKYVEFRMHGYRCGRSE